MVDTGSPVTVLRKDLAPELGMRIGEQVMEWSQGRITNGVYLAPNIYLGDTPLHTEGVILTDEHKSILGTDVLRYYCIQLDFNSNKMRFLDPDHLQTNDLGQAFPLTISGDHVIVHARLLGVNKWVVDTGSPFDGSMVAQDFARASKWQQVTPILISKHTQPSRGACFPLAKLDGHEYSDLYMAESPAHIPNIIGLAFMARNLVTLNLPKRVMYLKQVTSGSAILGGLLTLEARTFLEGLAEKGQLPGCPASNDDIDWVPETEDTERYPASRTLKYQTSGFIDVTSKIASLASSGAGDIPVSNDTAGGDPAPGIVKTLRVEYRHLESQQVTEAAEGEKLALPKGAEVMTAFYGNLPGKDAKLSQTDGEIFTHHFKVGKESGPSHWRLQRAWLTDEKGSIVEEYPAP